MMLSSRVSTIGVRSLRSRSSTAVTAAATSMNIRGLATRKLEADTSEPFVPPLDAVKPPEGWNISDPPPPLDPDAYVRNPVTSAHAIVDGKVSARDSAVISPNGESVVHGRYGELQASGVPLEYLALLRHAAEGAAAVRTITEKSSKGEGTILVYGATQPQGFAALQLASSAGYAVVGVVDGNHSGNTDMMDVVKAKTPEPGVAVTEEYALVKQNFKELVDKVCNGEIPAKDYTNYDPDAFLSEFKENLLAYIETYPDNRAAISEEHFEFKGKEKDRKNFKINMEAYYEQMPVGAPKIDPRLLDEKFTLHQYVAFKAKFGEQTSSIITGDETNPFDDFNPGRIVRDMVEAPEQVPSRLLMHPPPDGGDGLGPYIPYEFSVCKQSMPPPPTKSETGAGPILGAIISVSPILQEAAEFIANAGPSLRDKAEALQFLHHQQRNAYAAASSVAHLARQAGKPVIVVGGSLPGLDSLGEPTDEDVKEALSAMEVNEESVVNESGEAESRLNYFVQVYRAGDFPFYADYAVHRAQEPLSGPRQIVVTK